jgi:predicted aspartyl protease
MKKQFIFFLFAIFITITIFPQEHLIAPGNFRSAIIPLKFDNGCPVIEAKIDGITFHLLIDTGAEDAVVKLTPSALKKILVTTRSGEEQTYDYKGNAYKNMRFILSSFKIGDLEFTNLNATQELRSAVIEDGIIGNKLLKMFNVMFDYKSEKMILFALNSSPDEINNDNWIKLKIEHNNIGLILSCKTDLSEKELKFCLDTGVGSFENGKTYGIINPNVSNQVRRNGGSVNVQKFIVDGNNLAPFDFKFIDFKISSVDGFLGNNFFIKYKVLIDFNNNCLYLKKY